MTTARSFLPRQCDPQVIAVEGLCYAGKTTLAKALAPLIGATIIGEYTDLAALPPFPPRHSGDVAAALRHFLQLEQGRARAARAAGTPVVLLDRSPLTLIAHECGIACLNAPCDPAAAAEIYSTAAETGEILTPDAYLYLSVPEHIAAARQALRGPVPAHLMHPQVRARIDRACRAYLTALPPQRHLELDGTIPPPTLAAKAARFLPSITSRPPGPDWRMLPAAPAVIAGDQT